MAPGWLATRSRCRATADGGRLTPGEPPRPAAAVAERIAAALAFAEASPFPDIAN
jgi:hypothetical protein